MQSANVCALINSSQPLVTTVSKGEDNQDSTLEPHKEPNDLLLNNISSANRCRVLNFITRICCTVKSHWQNLKDDFRALDRHGRLFVTIDQAISLMRKYAFPLTEKQQCELAVLFSPEKNGQFHYFDFMQYFITPSTTHTSTFSRSTHSIQSKQPWGSSAITIDGIFHRVRSQCMITYGSIHRTFNAFDKTRQRNLSTWEFDQLLRKFDIQLDAEELYHIVSEIDKNQDGRVSFDEFYDALISDALQI